MHFRSLHDLQRDIVANIHRLPDDVDLVVGIPRSGMLVASLVALALNLPLADIDGFAEGRTLSRGTTRLGKAASAEDARVRRALIIDDSSRTGEAMRSARQKLAHLEGNDTALTFCVVYTVPGVDTGVDLSLSNVPVPRVFEWNVLHHPILGTACVDIDGVLCHDPSGAENDDGEAYRAFLSNARPLHRTTHAIGTLVTSRLEKYRKDTEAWLAAQGIEYRELVMLDLPDAETRRRLGAHGRFKGEHYRNAASDLFIESERQQAVEIANISGKPVLCMDGPVMCYPGDVAPEIFHAWREQRTGFKRLVHRLVGERAYRGLQAIARTRADAQLTT